MATFTVTFKAGIWLLFSIAVSMFSGTFSTVEEGKITQAKFQKVKLCDSCEQSVFPGEVETNESSNSLDGRNRSYEIIDRLEQGSSNLDSRKRSLWRLGECSLHRQTCNSLVSFLVPKHSSNVSSPCLTKGQISSFLTCLLLKVSANVQDAVWRYTTTDAVT